MQFKVSSVFIALFLFCNAIDVRAQRHPIVRDSTRFLAQFDATRFTNDQIDSIRTQVYGATLVAKLGARVKGYTSEIWKFTYPVTAQHGSQTLKLNTIIEIATDGKGMSNASGLTPEYEIPSLGETAFSIGFGCQDNSAINDGTCVPASFSPQDSLIVAIIDTGLDSIDLNGTRGTPYRDTLSSRILRDASGTIVGLDCSDTTYATTDNFPQDENGHGTHVTGIIAKTVAAYPNAKIRFMIIRALNKNGNGSLLGLQQAVQFAVENRAKVVNMSLSFLADKEIMEGTPLQEIMEKAGRDNNVLFVVAAGNHGKDIDLPSSVGYYPANFKMPNIIAVAALDSNCTSTLAPFSNRGVKSVDLAAPGRLIRSTELRTSPTASGFDSYRSGTSMAAPHVAAAAALAGNFKYKNADFEYQPVWEAIQKSVKTTPVSIDNLRLRGRLNTCGALQIIAPTTDLKPILLSNKYYVSPNPISNQALRIEWNAENEPVTQFQLYNMAGQLVESRNLTHYAGKSYDTWDIATPLSSGMYLLKIITQNGTVAVQKLVKE